MEAAGVAEPVLPEQWSMTHRRKWPSKLLGWRPVTNCNLSPDGYFGALRWSRPLLARLSTADDGRGLDLQVETSMKRPWKPTTEQLAEWQSKAEIVFGPEAQSKLMNLSLPVSIVMGAALAGDSVRWPEVPRLYLRLKRPGASDLDGWMCDCEVTDATLGVVHAQCQRPREGRRTWVVEHARSHGIFGLPAILVEGVASAWSTVLRSWGQDTDVHEPVAVIPSTRMRASSDGLAAALRLVSAEGLGYGWDGSVEVDTRGWSTQLRLKADVNEGFWEYVVRSFSGWNQRSRYSHEVKCGLEQGTAIWASMGKGDCGKPRFNIGMEMR